MIGAPLRQVLTVLSGPLAELVAAPRGHDVPVRDVVITEPDGDTGVETGDLVLVIGVRGAAATGSVLAAGREGAAAVAVKAAPDQSFEQLRQAASDAGVALVVVSPQARWEQVEALARAVVDSAAIELDADPASGDLFSLAQTLATLTGGCVSIEDSASRLLAYSRCDDQVDELRRLTILGRNGPEQYLALLREWGVFQRLRQGDEVVRIDARPELGIRARLVGAVQAGTRTLGSIWVQEGHERLADCSVEALRGAARLAAPHLIRNRGDARWSAGPSEDCAAALLDGRLAAGSLAGSIGVDPDSSAQVIAVDLRDDGPPRDGGRLQRELRRAEAAEMVAVHAAAYRRDALVTQLDGRIYVLLLGSETGATTESTTPGGPPSRPQPAAALSRWTADVVSVLRGRLGTPVQAAVADAAPRLADVPAARRGADRILDAMTREPERAVAVSADVRAGMVLAEVLAALADRPEIRHPALDALVAYDAEHGSELARSLLMWLDAFGDVAAVAERLHVHPNTLRHRLRRISSLVDLDLEDPEHRLVAMLLLRRATRD